MRQLVFHGPRRLTVEEGAEPPVSADEVRVAVHSVGVCGSDVHGYAGVNRRRQPGMVMGHEAAGTVVETGAAVDGLTPGTRVAINPILSCGECEFCRAGSDNVCPERRIYGCVPGLAGAYADSVVVKASCCVPFAGPAPFEWAALAEPLSVGARAARVGEVGDGDRVVVVGGGPIGIAAALASRRRGADVLVSEPLAHRREVAAGLGFATIDPTAEEVPRSAFPISIECVGHSITFNTALEAVKPHGRMVFVGLAEETLELKPTPLMVGERVIKGSAAYAADDFRATARWIASGEEDLAPLIEARVGLDELPEVFEGYAEGRIDALKTLLQLDA